MSPSSCTLVRRVSVLVLVLCGAGCGPSKPVPAAAPPATAAAPPATVAIAPASEEAEPELAASEPAAVTSEPLEQLLAREAIFWSESGVPCGDGRAALVLPGSDRPSNLELAERAGCQGASVPGEAASVREVCCPRPLEIPSREQTGGGASCAGALTEYLGIVQQSGAVPPTMAGLTMTIQQHASRLSERDYIAHCQIPALMSVRICAAIRSGRAEGVTVITDPPSLGKAECVARAVRSLGLPPLPVPVMDLTRAEILADPKSP